MDKQYKKKKRFCRTSRFCRKIRGICIFSAEIWQVINRKRRHRFQIALHFQYCPSLLTGRKQTRDICKEQGTDFTCLCPELAAACCAWNEERRFRQGRQKAHAGSKWTALGPPNRAENRRPCLLWRLETVSLSSPV